MDLRTLDLTDDHVLSQAYAIESAATRDARPGWMPLGEAARIAAWRADNGWVVRLTGAVEDRQLIGVASCLTAEDTPDTSWLSVSVLPAHQSRGVGSRLARAVEATSAQDVTRFVASAYRATSAEIERLLHSFAAPLGYAVATTETVVELDLSAATLTPVAPVEGYTVSTHLGGVPEPLCAQVGVLKGLVDAEAPNGDLAWQPTPASAQEYADEVAFWGSQGRTVVESLAVDTAGEVAAWTCLLVAADSRRAAQIEGTLVLAEHRGRGLGLAVKTEALLAARAHGGVARVRTSSDDQNVWMRALNDRLGFVPVESEVLLHKQTARVSSGRTPVWGTP